MRRFYTSFFLFIVILFLDCLSSAAHGEIVARETTTSIESQKDDQIPPKPTDMDHRDPPRDPPKDPPKDPRVTTEISIVYTTIVYTSSTPTPTVYNVSNTNPGYQEQSTQPSNDSTDPNGQSIQESLHDDQQALRRMIMILSLVGGLGVIAIVATIVIFTRMRVKNKRQREMEERNEELSDEQLIPPPSDNNNDHGVMIHSASSLTSLSVDLSDDRQYLEPSAPPALVSTDNVNSRRNLVSLISQTSAPSPSAPTAKELDAMIDEDTNEASSHYHSSSHIHACSRCAPLLDPPELPPPAYTPSAPPHYILPPETSSSSTHLPSRRHSLGT